VPAAQHRKVRQRRRATLGPVVDVVALAEAHGAAREATFTTCGTAFSCSSQLSRVDSNVVQ
jgi:hypothetical protein